MLDADQKDSFEGTAFLQSMSTNPLPLMPNGFLLLIQECVEHGLLDVHFVRAPAVSYTHLTLPTNREV